MSSTSVFKSLRELFPQVDLRILRAISIEHEEDINEAIEFILSEVLPEANTTPDFSHSTHGTDNPEQELKERDNEPEHTNIPDDESVSPFGTPHYIGAENHGLHSSVADGTKRCVLGKPPLVFLDANSSSEPGREKSMHNNSFSLNLNHLSGKDDENVYNAHDKSDHFESILDGGSEKIIQTGELVCANMALHADTEAIFQLRDEENISVQLDEQTILLPVFDNCESTMDYRAKKQNTINIQSNICNELSGCSSDGFRPLNLRDIETVVYTPPSSTCSLSLSDVTEKDQNFQDSTTETYKDAIDNENHNSFSLDVNYLELSSDENTLPISLATRSAYAVSTDVLEDSIMDAKNNKKSLVSSLESMVSMMQEVNLLEEKAKQANDEALVDGDHIYGTVKELQQIVKKSKDENDMLSGLVYGERSILATEVRELQARLLRMSEERSKYLSIIEEIFRALEVRQLAAKDAIAAADLEKREKEEVTLKALKEQELMRDAMVAESQILEQEAEENNKLREFLMDRGHVVDSLQGEIAIICEDILSLKEKVNGRIPLTKSLMASYSSSCGFSVNSSDHNGGSPSSTSHVTNNKETFENLQQVENTTASLKLLDDRYSALDDWELFEQ